MLATETIEMKDDIKEIERPKKKNSLIIIIIVILILFILTSAFSTAFALYNMTNEKIIQGVSVRGIDTGGLTKEEAIKKVTQILNNELEKNLMLVHDGYKTSINAKQIDFVYNIEETVENAYKKGKEKGIIENNYNIINIYFNKVDVPLKYNYSEQKADAIISEIEAQLPDAVKQPSYYVENDNIVLIAGTPGSVIKKEELKNIIIEAILNKSDVIEIPVETVEPYLVDVDKFRELIYVEPKDAYYTKDPFEIHPEVIGVDFNVEEVKQMLQEKQEKYIIPLIYTTPEITKNQIGTEAFPDLLSTFSTKYKSSDRNRTTNLKLASEKINGVVLMPGEEFSYNRTLGPRTSATGYKNAKIFSNGQVIDGIGGGICQISSTLYNAVLYADLEVTERRNHQFVPSYLKAGLDATVVYGSQDFKFKNTRNYPIKIISEVSNGIAKIDIFGIREDVEYEVKVQPVVIQSNSSTIKSITYKYRYLNGQEIDKVVVSRDTYKR